MSDDRAEPVLRFAHFELVPAERVLRVRGEPVAVGSRAFDLLLALAQRHDRLVTKPELLDLVWPGLVVEEHNIATQISTLRKLIGTHSIATLPGYGYRLTAAPQLQDSPPPGAAPTPRHNLPQPRTRFIGRESVLADLAQLQPVSRLLTLTGIGGCGKTRLALQFAQAQLGGFDDGAFWIDLAPLGDAERVVASCAAVFGLREEGERPLIDRLIEHLAPRRTLLVLDNCEHVLDSVAALVDSLLGATSGTRIVATSREALRVAGEQVYPVPSLSLPATAELGTVRSAEAVRVFIDRARLVWPDFEVDAGIAAPVAEICRRLDGIALAIELAAARVPMLSVAEIADRLDDRFHLLGGGSRAVPRHQTLHAVMQWSDELLEPLQQRMLRQMAVFAGGWTLPAAVAVAACADDYEALKLLSALHDKSLIVVDRDAADGPPRYRMLETVRQYAWQRLHDCAEAETARGRHVDHYLALAETAEARVHGPEQDAWMNRFRQEHDNLVAALSWCIEGPLDPQLGLQLAAATSFYWIWNGVEMGYRLTRAVLEHEHATADTLPRLRSLRSLAHLSLFRGRYEESLDHALQALAIARRLGEPRALAEALHAAGAALCTAGRIDGALRAQEEALGLASRLDDAGLTSSILNSLAESRRSSGQLEMAQAHYHEALGIARREGGRLAVAVVLNNLIRVQVALGCPEQAWPLARECLALVHDQKVGVDLLEAAVGLASCRGEHDIAARWWGAADQTLRDWGYRHQPVDVGHSARLIAASRRALGEAAFDAAEAAGRRLPFDQAMHELATWLERVA